MSGDGFEPAILGSGVVESNDVTPDVVAARAQIAAEKATPATPAATKPQTIGGEIQPQKKPAMPTWDKPTTNPAEGTRRLAAPRAAAGVAPPKPATPTPRVLTAQEQKQQTYQPMKDSQRAMLLGQPPPPPQTTTQRTPQSDVDAKRQATMAKPEFFDDKHPDHYKAVRELNRCSGPPAARPAMRDAATATRTAAAVGLLHCRRWPHRQRQMLAASP